MTLDARFERLRARAMRALGEHDVGAAVAKVRAVIGPPEASPDSPLAEAALRKMHNGIVPSADELTALELVVRRLRPFVFSKNGQLDALPDGRGQNLYPEPLREAWNAFRRNVTPFVSSVGRIEDSKQAHIGTGFVVSQNRIATNRHVLAALTLGSEALRRGSARIVFKEEKGLTNRAADIVDIEGVAAIHPQLDLVLLAIGAKSRPALPFDDQPVDDGSQVVVVGYPGRDSVNNPLFLDSVFNGAFGKRGAALGEVLNGTASPNVYHDCSTTQGNSGSPILSLATARVAGIHRSGFFMYRNEGIFANELKRFVEIS